MLAQAGEDAFGEEVGALDRVMEIFVSEERAVDGLPVAEQRQQIDHREVVPRAQGFQDFERALRREEVRADPCSLAPGRRGCRAHLMGMGIGDQDEARAEAVRQIADPADVPAGERPRSADLLSVDLSCDRKRIVAEVADQATLFQTDEIELPLAEEPRAER